MHAEAFDWVRQHARDGCAVLDIGGRNINGSVRSLFGDDYTALDLHEGPGVDVVADVTEWKSKRKFDVVVCCEVLEHTDADIIGAAHRLLKNGGLLILTAAGPGRAPHSAFDGAQLRPGEYYRNVTEADLKAKFAKGWSEYTIDVTGPDIRAVAVK